MLHDIWYFLIHATTISCFWADPWYEIVAGRDIIGDDLPVALLGETKSFLAAWALTLLLRAVLVVVKVVRVPFHIVGFLLRLLFKK